jgi:A/G-specific adenine glycosylase
MAAAVTPGSAARFGRLVVDWQMRHGRHDLPWQRSRDAYSIWVSEIMLQQTQVATVIPFYERFMRRFPDVAALASAPLDDVMQAWSGLGYYTRARNLHKAAHVIVADHGAQVPASVDALAALPGVGRSTAAAIAALAYGVRGAILDGNVKRVLCRSFGVEGDPASGRVERSLWTLAEALSPEDDIAAYTQGMMDIGATVCVRARPLCDRCPLQSACMAFQQGRTDELPQPRRRRPVPERDVAMLVVRRGAQVLLEKRPESGIWGGLWSLPETAVDDDLRAYCARRFGPTDIALCELPGLTHGFTHFRLRIRPWRVDLDGPTSSVAEPGSMWMQLEDARRAALPVPIKRILESQQ